MLHCVLQFMGGMQYCSSFCLCFVHCVHALVLQLMDGRKAVGGKLEVKIRIRDPYVTKQVEEVKEKWLVIDHFDRQLPPAAASEVNIPLLIDSLL